MNNVIQVCEYQKLTLGDAGFEQNHFDCLTRYHERQGRRYYEIGHRCIRFLNWVGVIQVGNLTIEVLPKTDDDRGNGDTEKTRWRDLLVQMLRRSGYLKLETHSNAQLQMEKASLLEIYLNSFLEEVRVVVHQGMVRKYRRTQGNLGALKGRLLFNEQVRCNLTHRERFFTEHECYDRDNAFNRILKTAIEETKRCTASPHLRGLTAELLLHFEPVRTLTDTSACFRTLTYSRNTERYRPAMRLAELILHNLSPNQHAGRRDVLAIMFEMDALFEHYVYCELQRAARSEAFPGLIVTGQERKTFWSADGDGERPTSIRPDIVLSFGDGKMPALILDTKWKLPDNGRPADADLRQMYVYNRQFGSHQSYLLYPSVNNNQRTRNGKFDCGAHANIPVHRCGMYYINLWDDNEPPQLDKEFGVKLAKRLTEAAIE